MTAQKKIGNQVKGTVLYCYEAVVAILCDIGISHFLSCSVLFSGSMAPLFEWMVSLQKIHRLLRMLDFPRPFDEMPSACNL